MPLSQNSATHRSVAEIIAQYGHAARKRLQPFFELAEIAYPPRDAILLAMKDEKKLELWASDGGDFNYIRSYKIRKTSGKRGPKLREGDRQIPEGVYQIVKLNPNSAYHLSMKLDYPNAFDLLHAEQEGREQPGSNIFIHGKAVSIGCLAMGDAAIEELFVLTENIGMEHVSVVIAPYDPRHRPLHVDPLRMPRWTDELYRIITGEFLKYKHP